MKMTKQIQFLTTNLQSMGYDGVRARSGSQKPAAFFLTGLQALPKGAKPIDEWDKLDAAWSSVAAKIEEMARKRGRKGQVRGEGPGRFRARR